MQNEEFCCQPNMRWANRTPASTQGAIPNCHSQNQTKCCSSITMSLQPVTVRPSPNMKRRGSGQSLMNYEILREGPFENLWEGPGSEIMQLYCCSYSADFLRKRAHRTCNENTRCSVWSKLGLDKESWSGEYMPTIRIVNESLPNLPNRAYFF